jgi:pyruvate dehydrogenase E2 component (dihydrolipoamide acetyltransferase)
MANIIEMPKLGFDMAEGTLNKWIKSVGEAIEKGDVIAEIETDKATVEVESTFTGVVFKHLADEGQALPVGTPIAVVAKAGEDVDMHTLLITSSAAHPAINKKSESIPTSLETTDATPVTTQTSRDDLIKASPVAKRIATEKGIDLTSVAGTGPGGRIIKRDIEKAVSDGAALTSKRFSVSPGRDETMEISKLRAAIGKRLVESRQTVPHFYITSVSVNDFIIRAVALALRNFPNLNASLDGIKLTRHSNINIGVAVAIENGLLIVVVRNADQKNLMQISTEGREMIGRVKEGKVRNEDIEGSTFTISNLGMYDVEDFVAIINPPEAAILAIGSAKEVPVVFNGEIEIGWRMKATISADHRITDGAEAAEFMQHLALFFEQPWRLFA